MVLGGFRCFSDIEGNSTNKNVFVLSLFLLVNTVNLNQSINAKLFLPIIPIGIAVGRKMNFFSGSHLAPKYFKVAANSKKLVAIMTHTHKKAMKNKPTKFPQATKRTLEWIIYNVKSYLNPRWRLVTIDLRSKLRMCCILETLDL